MTLNKLSKEDAVKHLWDAQETISKTLKSLSKNLASKNTQDSLWDALAICNNNIRWIKNFHIGSFYKIEDYDKNYAIFKLETFIEGDTSIRCHCRVLTASNKRVNYQDFNTDYIILSISELDRKEFEIIPEDLPLYVGNDFNGSLLQELLK